MSALTFQAAEFIELHDSGVCLFPEDSSDSCGWREFREYEGTAFSIQGEDLCRIARMFGLDPQAIDAKSTKGEVQRIDPECLEFRVVKSRQDVGCKIDSRHYGAMERIKNLWARIDAPHLLQIKVEFYVLGEVDQTRTKQVSYSGNFSVWWK